MTPRQREEQAQRLLDEVIATAGSISEEAERLTRDHQRIEETNERLKMLVRRLEGMRRA